MPLYFSSEPEAKVCGVKDPHEDEDKSCEVRTPHEDENMVCTDETAVEETKDCDDETPVDI